MIHKKRKISAGAAYKNNSQHNDHAVSMPQIDAKIDVAT